MASLNLRTQRRPLLRLMMLLSLLLAGGAPAALAQIRPTTARQIREANREAKRQAKKMDTPYKDTHLQVSTRLKRGEGDRPEPEGSNNLRFERDGTPRVVEPKACFICPPRKKKETQTAVR